VIFVDTSAWFSLSVPSEPEHGRCVEWLSSNREPLLTTDYIIDEVLTLMRMRREARRARRLGQQLLEGRIATIEWVLQVAQGNRHRDDPLARGHPGDDLLDEMGRLLRHAPSGT
jgi:predicted nucleic acid-binding protein